MDVTNLITYDRARPLHVYDAAKLTGGFVEARLGREGERVEALDGKTYAGHPGDVRHRRRLRAPSAWAGSWAARATGCSEATTEVFIESAWFDPIRTAQTGRDHRHHLRRPVPLRPRRRSAVPGSGPGAGDAADPGALRRRGLGVRFAGAPPAPPAAIAFDPAYVERLTGLAVAPKRVWAILADLGFTVEAGRVQPPSWRRDVEGKADLVEEVARIDGYGALPSTPLPEVPRPIGGILTPRQGRMRTARRALAAAGYLEGGHLVVHGAGDRGPVRRRRGRRWCCKTPSPPNSTACAPRSCRA